MLCEICNKGSVVEIRMNIGGEELTFHRCGHCERQVWNSPNGDLQLTDVLELARHS